MGEHVDRLREPHMVGCAVAIGRIKRCRPRRRLRAQGNQRAADWNGAAYLAELYFAADH